MTGDDLAEKVAAVLWGKFGAEDHSPLAAWLTEQDCRRMAAALLPLIREREAVAWERGFASGKSRAMRYMSDEPGLSLDAANPYAGSEGA